VKVRTILTVLFLSLILAALGFLVAARVDLMPLSASTRAEHVDQLTGVLLGVSTVIFLIVEGALLYAVIRFRRKPDDLEDAVPYHGNNTLELIWTLIPAVLVVGIGVNAVQVLQRIETHAQDEMVIEVVSRQFLWEFRYPEMGFSSPELHIPVGKSVRFDITSADVIHSFWVPEFRAKQDATPGRISVLRITPNKIGTYPIRCAELCGAGHAAMNAKVVVESEGDFNAWAASQMEGSLQVPSPQPESEAATGPPPEQGVILFQEYGCGACHIYEKAGGAGEVGPSLDLWRSNRTSRVEGLNPREYIRQSILDPNAYIVEGYLANLMPQDYQARMSDAEVEALVEMLLQD
jgi:cytochrome c oxidase subunit 2